MKTLRNTYIICSICILGLIALTLTQLRSSWNFSWFINYNFGTENRELIKTENIEDSLNDIEIRVSDTDVNIIVQEGLNETKVEVYGDKNNTRKITVEENGGKLLIKQGSNSFVFGFNWNRSSTVNIYLPAEYAENLNISTVSGDINLTNGALKEVSLQSTSGDILVRETSSQSMILKSVSGDMAVYDANSVLDGKTTSGDISIYRISGSLTLSSISGEIELQNAAQLEASSFSTTSGDIDLQLTDSMNYCFTTSTVSGSIITNNVITGCTDLPAIQIKTISGDISVND